MAEGAGAQVADADCVTSPEVHCIGVSGAKPTGDVRRILSCVRNRKYVHCPSSQREEDELRKDMRQSAPKAHLDFGV